MADGRWQKSDNGDGISRNVLGYYYVATRSAAMRQMVVSDFRHPPSAIRLKA